MTISVSLCWCRDRGGDTETDLGREKEERVSSKLSENLS